MRKFTISDIHGCLKTFKALLNKIEFTKEDELYLLGDFIDRGPNSKGVFDDIWKMQKDGYSVFCLRGNHDQMMLDAQHDLRWSRSWMLNGGDTTVESFNANLISEIPKVYFDFIEAMPYYIEVENYILVHAGFSFDMPNPFDELNSMLWKRKWYLNINFHWLGDRTIIHGHTPIGKKAIEEMLEKIDDTQVLNIDSGCVHKGKGLQYGDLACFELISQQLFFQKNIDF